MQTHIAPAATRPYDSAPPHPWMEVLSMLGLGLDPGLMALVHQTPATMAGHQGSALPQASCHPHASTH